jgi:hypothetical protein
MREEKLELSKAKASVGTVLVNGREVMSERSNSRLGLTTYAACIVDNA